jgi:hypothetical protein
MRDDIRQLLEISTTAPWMPTDKLLDIAERNGFRVMSDGSIMDIYDRFEEC